MLSKLYQFRDLKALNIVKSRAQLQHRIKYEGFPKGRLTSNNQRTWTEAEVENHLNKPRKPRPLMGRAKALHEEKLQRQRQARATTTDPASKREKREAEGKEHPPDAA
jgi:hypothetical protein